MTHRSPLQISVRRLTLACLLLLTAHWLLPTANAQTVSATLSGTVTDANGAVVPGVTVTVTDPATRLQRTATTNDTGRFVVPFLPPSTYSVTLEHAGFMIAVINDVVLNVNDDQSLKIQLKTGNIKETVNITGQEPLSSESSAVSTVVDQQFVQNMPLNGRTFQALLALVPGVVPTAGDARQFNANGQRGISNSTSIDGVSANVAGGLAPGTVGLYSTGSMMGVTTSGTTQAIATMDELQEFTVQTAGYGAELGRQSGAQISFATKSGTNQFHGSAYEYFRNEILDANDWFLNRQGLKRPKLRQNDFGGTFGGPIIKDKTFFFLALEDDPLLTPFVKTNTVPTQAYKNAAAPAMMPLLNMFPLPNGAIAANGLSGAFLLSDSVRNPVNAESLKLDQKIGSRLVMFARYHRSPSQSVTPSFLSDNQVLFTNTQTATYGATWTVTPRTVDQLRFNWSRSSSGRELSFRSTAGTTLAPDSALWPSGYSAANAAVLVNIREPSFSSGPVYLGQNNKTIQRQYQLTDSLSLVRGNHIVEIGADWRHLAPQIEQVLNNTNLFITTAATAQARMSASAFGSGKFVLNSLSLYVADAWKFSPRLTLNLGVRWELEPPPRATQDPQFFAAQNFDPNNLSVATLAPQGTPVWKTRYTNFVPRLGAAYHLLDKPGRDTVVRGAFGVYYDMGVGDPMGFVSGAPYSRSGPTITGTYPAILSNPALVPPPVNLNPPFSGLKLFDPNLRMPYTLSWNFGVQQSLGQNQSISADYVGNRGKRLLMSIQNFYPGNPLITATGALTEETNLAASWYDALQVQFKRRLAHGLQVLANYTLSNSTDTASDEIAPSIPGGAIPVAMNRGASSYDVRHNFTAAATWRIPVPFGNRALKAALGGWSLNPLVRAYSAKPTDPSYGYSVTGAASYSLRPDVVPGQPVWISDPSAPGGKRLNIAAFSIPLFTDPSKLRQGTAARNSIRGFPSTQWDIAVRRDFKVTERITLQFSGEIYNVFNHPNFGDPIPYYGSYDDGVFSAPSTATFGLATQMLSNPGGNPRYAIAPIYAFGGQRDIQFSFKVTF